MRQREMILNSYFTKKDRKRRVLFEKTTQHTDVEEFDKNFPAKEKLKLPDQIFG
jgi:hypothetical protein